MPSSKVKFARCGIPVQREKNHEESPTTLHYNFQSLKVQRSVTRLSSLLGMSSCEKYFKRRQIDQKICILLPFICPSNLPSTGSSHLGTQGAENPPEVRVDYLRCCGEPRHCPFAAIRGGGGRSEAVHGSQKKHPTLPLTIFLLHRFRLQGLP